MQTPSTGRHSSRIQRATAGLGLGLLLGPLALIGTADARVPEREQVTRQAATADVQRPAVERPERKRPDRNLEVLQMKCEVADGDVDGDVNVNASRTADNEADATRVRIGCRWRAAQHEKAAGYQLWRIVDRGERELVARGRLDFLGARDAVPAKASVVRFAVIAVNEDGRRVAQSRVQRIVLNDQDPTVDAKRARPRRVGNHR